jgi:hypothetical protein
MATLIVKVMDVSKGLFDPKVPVQVSFNDGDAQTMAKPTTDKPVGLFKLDVPTGTDRMKITIARSGDYWDFSQTLSYAPGPPAAVANTGAVNPGSFPNASSNPDLTGATVEFWIILTQIRDGTNDYIAWAKDSATYQQDPFFLKQGASDPNDPKVKTRGDALNKDSSLVWGLPITPHAGRSHLFMKQPCYGTDTTATGFANVFQPTTTSGDTTGTALFLMRPTLPKLVCVWLPPGLSNPPTSPVSFHTFLHPDTVPAFYPGDQGSWTYPPYVPKDTTAHYPPAGTWVYPFRFDYAWNYIGWYMYEGKGLVPAHQLAQKQTVFVMPIGYVGGQWGTSLLSWDGQHRLLQEINFFLQRGLPDPSAAVSLSKLQDVGPSALSGFSAGGKFMRMTFSQPKTSQRAKTYFDSVLKEIYLFDCVADSTGASVSSGFQGQLTTWYRNGADQRIIRSYSQSPEWNGLASTVVPSPTTQQTFLDGSEKYGSSGSIVYVPLTVFAKVYPPGISYGQAHQEFPDHWPAHAVANSNFP